MGLCPRVAHAELDSALGRLLLGANQDAEPGGVDELDPAEIDNYG